MASGSGVECINGKVLYQLLDCTLAEEDYEHVTLYIRKNLNFYNYVSVVSKKSFEYKNIRLTVDYEEDYLLVEKIVDYFNSKNQKISIDKINSLYISNPSFFKINKQAQQTKIGGKEW